jgi:NIMA (never in mitosis gene a)-related kinase 1/4/5
MADGFSLLNELGRGSYATVHLAKRKLDGKLYALKQVRLTGLKPKDVDSALKEVRFLSTLGHPHVISYREAFLDSRQEYLYIVLDYADKGDVEAKIREYASRKRRYTEAEVWRAASHIASGLAYLHENKILHRDIKAANIFVC